MTAKPKPGLPYPLRLTIAVGGYARGTVFTKPPGSQAVLSKLEGWARSGIAVPDRPETSAADDSSDDD